MFKIGDKVKIVSKGARIENFEHHSVKDTLYIEDYYWNDPEMNYTLGMTGQIIDIIEHPNGEVSYDVRFETRETWYYFAESLEKVE